ncbi:putative divalent heavy-metal cations transporter [Halobacteroides halobius DSM 5150]|uniref:Zinc transporter ZupT n=1 Tax=Halobacteroides halobius (strain ATCC 35273 / DSM 5150 / MD-1) TaxID=748449 RepID=L0K8R6_HALHC|nr:zinc transporter ZupT [Halobacteroides halobius]AGB40749.1 putative divalent heavy-metal cations transporter [Halobacteroides halobius DSM 5150]
MNNFSIAFLLTLFAGLATGIGSVLVLFIKDVKKSFLSISLGFSAGVMIYVSFIEIFFKAQESLVSYLGVRNGKIVTVVSFFLGVLMIGLIDKLVPDIENPHHAHNQNGANNLEQERGVDEDAQLLRMGAFSALAIAIHNFPEGLATFASALKDPSLGIPIAIAIAIHNIPEGISVSVPVYYATKDKKKAFFYSFLSGLSEPIGAFIGYFLLRSFFNDLVFGILFGMVAGIMVFISIDELLPTSRNYGQGHQEIYGFVAGMAVMAVSLLLF